jgi:hypothetical protein
MEDKKYLLEKMFIHESLINKSFVLLNEDLIVYENNNFIHIDYIYNSDNDTIMSAIFLGDNITREKKYHIYSYDAIICVDCYKPIEKIKGNINKQLSNIQADIKESYLGLNTEDKNMKRMLLCNYSDFIYKHKNDFILELKYLIQSYIGI